MKGLVQVSAAFLLLTGCQASGQSAERLVPFSSIQEMNGIVQSQQEIADLASVFTNEPEAASASTNIGDELASLLSKDLSPGAAEEPTGDEALGLNEDENENEEAVDSNPRFSEKASSLLDNLNAAIKADSTKIEHLHQQRENLSKHLEALLDRKNKLQELMKQKGQAVKNEASVSTSTTLDQAQHQNALEAINDGLDDEL